MWPAGKKADAPSVARADEKLARRARGKAEDRDEPVGQAENMAAVWIKRNSEHPESVKFVRWGPHKGRQDLADLFVKNGLVKEWEGLSKLHEGSIPYLRVRVVFEADGRPQDHDRFDFLASNAVAVREGVVRLDLLVSVSDTLVPLHVMRQQKGVFSGDEALFNRHGDQWWDVARRHFARDFPSIPEKD